MGIGLSPTANPFKAMAYLGFFINIRISVFRRPGTLDNGKMSVGRDILLLER